MKLSNGWVACKAAKGPRRYFQITVVGSHDVADSGVQALTAAVSQGGRTPASGMSVIGYFGSVIPRNPLLLLLLSAPCTKTIQTKEKTKV